jgi:hypothetical protein
MSIDPDNVLSHHTFNRSDSMPGRPPSRVLDSASSHHPSSSSNIIQRRHTSNSTDSVPTHTPPPGSTLDHVADSALSRRISVSSDSTPSSPLLHVIPVSMPIRYSPPVPISIPVLQPPPILDQPPVPVSVRIRRSFSSSDSTVSHHAPSGPDSVSDHCPPPPDSTPSHRSAHIVDCASSRRTSIDSIIMPGLPPHPVGVRIPQPLGQTRPTSPAGYTTVVVPITPSNRAFSTGLFRQLPPIITVVPGTLGPLTPDSMSDLYPLHIPDNMPSSYLSGGFYEMQISIREDFGGIGMEHHRADLLQQLDHVIGRLGRGLENLKQHNPEFNEAHLQRTKHQYQYLREILLKMGAQRGQSHVAFNDHAPPESHTTAIRDVSPTVLVVPMPEHREPPTPPRKLTTLLTESVGRCVSYLTSANVVTP